MYCDFCLYINLEANALSCIGIEEINVFLCALEKRAVSSSYKWTARVNRCWASISVAPQSNADRLLQCGGNRSAASQSGLSEICP